MRVYIALSTIVTILCHIDRGDDPPETLWPTDKPRPEWQEWLRASIAVGGFILVLSLLMAWQSPAP